MSQLTDKALLEMTVELTKAAISAPDSKSPLQNPERIVTLLETTHRKLRELRDDGTTA